MKFQNKFRRKKFLTKGMVGVIAIFLLAFCTSGTINTKAMGEAYPKGYVKVASGLNLRRAPNTDSPIITELVPGEIVSILFSSNETEENKETEGWTKVQTDEDIVGYVKNEFLVIPEVDQNEYELLSVAVITKTDGSSENRNFNMEKAAGIINKMVLEPNEKFAWYDTKDIKGAIGPASEENGYKKAPVIKEGKSALGYGGGVCQVSTALYNCILKLEIEPDEIYHHSKQSSYVEKGMDATVAYSENPKDLKNFVFTNTKEYPIKLEAYTDGPQVVIAVYRVW